MAISMNQVLTGRCDLTRCGLHKPPLYWGQDEVSTQPSFSNMELNPQFVIDFLQNDPGLDDTSLNLLLPDARGDPQYSNLSQTTPSLDYEITTDVLPSITQPEQRTSTPTPTEPSITRRLFPSCFAGKSTALSIRTARLWGKHGAAQEGFTSETRHPPSASPSPIHLPTSTCDTTTIARNVHLSRQKESSGLGLSIVRAAGKHGRCLL